MREAAPSDSGGGRFRTRRLSCPRPARQAGTRWGSSTIEKRTPALWRLSSETSRQHSSASCLLLNGPLTCAEPSTSLWKFIEPNSPPITQKLLPLVIIVSCCSTPELLGCLNVDFGFLRLELRSFRRVVQRSGRRGTAGDGGGHQIEIAGADLALVAR